MAEKHKLLLPPDFGRGVNYGIAVCEDCGAEWTVWYSQYGIEFSPRGEAECPALENYRKAVAEAEQIW